MKVSNSTHRNFIEGFDGFNRPKSLTENLVAQLPVVGIANGDTGIVYNHHVAILAETYVLCCDVDLNMYYEMLPVNVTEEGNSILENFKNN